ncbi:hypothetical protein XENOCAPTIV_011127, partial [Xenoophorus captivus]
NPALASNLENTFAPASCPSVCSTDGSGCFSLMMYLFSSVRSMHILTLPELLGTTTIGAHQSVGSSTLVMTPSCCIRLSYSLTLGRRGRNICLGVERENGCASADRTILYSPSISPSPVKSLGNSCFTASIESKPIWFTLATNFNAIA